MTITMQDLIDLPSKTLEKLFESGTKEEIIEHMKRYGLEFKGTKVYPTAEVMSVYDDVSSFYGISEQSKKLSLNSSFGALLNIGSRFFDQRMGQSITLTGRTVTRHMCSKTNEMITGVYDHYGEAIIYGDTDSVAGDSIIECSKGHDIVPDTIENLFMNAEEFWVEGEKEYASYKDLMVMSYDTELGQPYLGHIEYIYRHKTTKQMWAVSDSFGNTVHVTEDHSVMVMREGELVEVKPKELDEDDIILTLEVYE